MNTMHLWYFINVAQTRSIRKAAQFCGTSPSTIASALKDLTGEMIVPLYKKTAFGVELTEEGRLLYTSAQNIISKLEQSKIVFKAKTFHVNDFLHFAAVPGVMAYIVAPVFNTLMSLYPNFKATFHTFNSNDLLHQIDMQQKDIGYINLTEDELTYYKEQFPNLHFQKFITCSSVFLTNNTHPLAKKVTVNAGELAQYPIVLYVHSDVIDNPFMRQTIYKNIQFTKNENYLLELIKEEYHYLTVVPYLNGRMQNEFFNINSQVLLFPQNDFTYYVTCVYHKSSPKHELIQDFLSFAKLFY